MAITLAIGGATLIDGRGGAPIPDAVVTIGGNRIVYAGPRHSAAPLPDGTPAVEATDRYLLPGLINCHDHLFQKRVRTAPLAAAASGPRLARPGHTDASLVLTTAYNALDELRQGITTTRDMGTPHHLSLVLRDAIDAGLAQGPRIIAAGEAVTMTGGHFHLYSRQADGPDEVRKAVREQLRAGADWVKLMASGGIAGWPHERPGESSTPSTSCAPASRRRTSVGGAWRRTP